MSNFLLYLKLKVVLDPDWTLHATLPLQVPLDLELMHLFNLVHLAASSLLALALVSIHVHIGGATPRQEKF